MNNTPHGFTYHYPLKDYESVRETQNWYINFATNKIWVWGTGLEYDIEINHETKMIRFSQRNWESHRPIFEAYQHYIYELIETEVLSEP